MKKETMIGKKISLIPLLLACSIFSATALGQAVEPARFQELLRETDGGQLLDVRTAEEFAQGHLRHAMLADVQTGSEFQRRISALDNEKPVFVYCLSGGRSHRAVELLKQSGFPKVIELKGGILAWKNKQLPLVHMAEVQEISQEVYQKSIKKKGLVLVDFGASWCPPCRKMEPILQKLNEKYSDQLIFMPIDAGEQSTLAEQLDIQTLPGLILYKNGKEVWRGQGVISADSLDKMMSSHIVVRE